MKKKKKGRITADRLIDFSKKLFFFSITEMASLSPPRVPAATAMPTKVAGSSSARAPAVSALTRRTPSSNRLATMGSSVAASANQQGVAPSSVPAALPRGPSFSGKGEEVAVVTLCHRVA